jgi:dUTP pyrophosphatase
MSDYNSDYFKKWFNMGADASIPEYFADRIKVDEVFDFAEWYKTHAPKVLGEHKINLPFKNESQNPDPQYATDGSSGFDLRANLDGEGRLEVGEVKIIPTGLFFEIPEGFEIQVRPRSGLAANNGVTVLNTPGTIDADYRGELKVILINHGKEAFIFNNGERIAQGVVAAVTAKNIINLTRVDSINEDTERGSGGFGSTGHL